VESYSLDVSYGCLFDDGLSDLLSPHLRPDSDLLYDSSSISQFRPSSPEITSFDVMPSEGEEEEVDGDGSTSTATKWYEEEGYGDDFGLLED